MGKMGKAIGEISVIQRYATKDGPGIRSTVFFRGAILFANGARILSC